MPNAATSPNETLRLAALEELGILYTPLENRFDKITRSLCRMFDMPIAYISLIDRDTQWIKSSQGLDLITTPRSTSICAHTLLVDESIICEDLTLDDRFKDNEYVTSGLKLRFYAGFALKIRGQNVGTMCILDVKPRVFSEADQAAMKDLASWAQTEISLTQLSEVQIKLITELDQAQREAQIDNQTGLWNQGAIKDVLQRAHHRHLLTQKPYSLMMVDIDNFKAINDTHGHIFGDQVIATVADEIKKSVRPSDTIGRYGGDEFLIILENCPYLRAKELSARLLNKIQQLKVTYKGTSITTSVSIGFTSTDEITIDSAECLLESADKALYKAKEEGRNCAKGSTQ